MNVVIFRVLSQRTLALRFIAALAFVQLLNLTTLVQAQETTRVVDGRINVRDEDFKPVFLDNLKFYPGTKVDLEIVSNVDAMRWMYETRECWSEWFGGIWCEYIKRSNSSGIGPDRAPLILELFDRTQDGGNPMQGPAATTPARLPANVDPFDPSSHLPVATSSLISLMVELDDASVQDAFNRGYVLKGRVAAKYKSGDSYPPIVRRSCDPHRNQEHCSQGQFIVKVKAVDTTSRYRMLERYLARKRSYVEISGEGVIDHFMKHEIVGGVSKPRLRVIEAAKLLVFHARLHHRLDSSGARNEDLRQILEYAVSLDPENPDARNDLVRYHIDSGSLAQAKAQGGEALKKFNDDYLVNKRDATTLRGLAQALRNAGQIMLKDRAATDLQDVEVANGFYERSLAIWAEYEKGGNPIGSGERLEIAQVNVDQARILGLIRSAPALQRASKKLEEARLQLPRVGRGMTTFVSSDGEHFLTASFFQPLAEVGKAQVLVGYLPSVNWTPVHAATSSGRVLLSREDDAKAISYAYWQLDSQSNEVSHIVALPPLLRLTGGRPYGTGLIGVDGITRDLVQVEGGKKEVLAKTLTNTAKWSSASDAAVAALAPARTKEKITIWREGKVFSFDPGAAEIADLAVSSNGRFLQILQSSNKGPELRFVDLNKVVKGESDASTIYKLEAPFANAELLFTQDEQFALQRADGLLAIVSANIPGEIKAVRYSEVGAPPLVVADRSRLAMMPRDQEGMVDKVALLDIAAAYGVGVPVKNYDSAPVIALKELKFQARVPGEGLVIAATGSKTGTDADRVVLLAKLLPAILQVHSFKSGRAMEKRALAWRHGDAVLLSGGENLVLRDRAAGSINILDLKSDSELRQFSGAVTKTGDFVNEIIPISGSKAGGFFVVIRDPDTGSVTFVETFAEPRATGLRYALPQPVGVGGGQLAWRLLRQPLGHLSPDQNRLVFLAARQSDPKILKGALVRSDYDSAYEALDLEPASIVEIDADGQATAGKIELRDPASTVAKVGDAFLQRRETGLAWTQPDGRLVYLDECGPKTGLDECSGGDVQFPPDGRSVVLARQSVEALDLTRWIVNGNGSVAVVWRCKACGSVRKDAYDSLASNFVGAWPRATFALGSDDTVLAPHQGVLGTGKPQETKWTRKLPLARPVALGTDMALVQRDGATFEIWRSR